MNRTTRVAWSAVVVAAALASAARAQDDAAVDHQVAALQPAVCQSQPDICSALKAFADAVAPCVPEGERLSVGHAYLIQDDGTVRPAEYFVLRSQRLGETILVQTQHVFSENDEERKAAEALVASIVAGAADPANPLYRYLVQSSGQIPQLMAQPQERSLVVLAEGPVIYLRQGGRQIYAVLPETVVTRPDGGGRQAGLLLAVLPALAACE